MPDSAPSDDSIDTLFAQQMPSWLRREDGHLHCIDRLRAFHKALLRQERAVAALRPVLAQIPSIEAFAEPLYVKSWCNWVKRLLTSGTARCVSGGVRSCRPLL